MSTSAGPASRRSARPRPSPQRRGQVRAGTQHTRGAAEVASSPAPQPARAPRVPFVLLVVGLLGGTLVSLLLLNTILAQGAFQLSGLQRETSQLEHREEALRRKVARAESPEVLARKARRQGMVPAPNPAFVDTGNGRVYGKPQPAPAPSQPQPDQGARGSEQGGEEGGQHGQHGQQEGDGGASGSNGQRQPGGG